MARPRPRLLTPRSPLCCLAGPAAAEPALPMRITQAFSAAGDGKGFPADAAQRSVALPDDWARTRPGDRGPVWYRFDFRSFDVQRDDDLAALYVEHACASLAVYLNGALVHGSGRSSAPPVGRCSEPRLVPLPAALIAWPARRSPRPARARAPARCRRSRSGRSRCLPRATRARWRSASRCRRQSARRCC
ncbi:MAG: hypothetical protein ABT20_19100 [Rubrivivax sp. SCN 70-15]|nr:MAG: hypothetical protein ABT20_19100 [Rubrivivax sp. SCN 70-15]